MELDHLKMMNDLTTDQNCFLSYVGTMSEDALELFGQKLRRHMRRFSLTPKQTRQAFSLYVEMMQNMIRYGDAGDHRADPDGNKPSYGLLAISHDDDAISIMGGNYISSQRAQMINKRLDALSTSTQIELRQLFMKTIRQPLEMNSKGANLGLIELMRRSSSPPQYRFDPAKNGTVFFMIKATA